MLNLFAATGHINYAKSGRLYIQLMMDLPNKHPWLYHKPAVEGHHVVRRTVKFWVGLCPDFVIEQVLMCSLKSRGGLTRGRGMSPSVRVLWVHSMHSCGSIHNAMTTPTQHYHKTSEQHEELGKSGLVADESINCDNAEEVGRAIYTKLDHASVAKCTIKRLDQVKSLGILKNAVKIKSQTVNTDPTRLLLVLVW